MTLNPGEEFVISRQLNDPADSGTYYMQAVIRNAKTDAIIQTVNLDNKGNQRFTKTWKVAYDPTGLGLYITITTTVYTDSGYATPSTDYGIEQHEHLIQDRVNPYMLPQASPDIDYKKIRKIVQEELGTLPKPADQKEPDLLPISEGLQAVISEVRAIKIPQPEKTDLQPVLRQIESVLKAVKDKRDFEDTDLSPVLAAIEDATESYQPLLAENTQKLEQMLERVREFYMDDIERIEKKMEDLSKQLKKIGYIIPNVNEDA
jgi:hypothetical protein